MKILIDGDSCRLSTFRLVENIAREADIPLIHVCDYSKDPPETDYAEVKLVDIGFNSADLYIVNHMQPGDIVITNDTGLAALALNRRGYAVTYYGFEYTDNNIGCLLNTRDMYAKSRRTSGKNKIKSNLKTCKNKKTPLPVALKKIIQKSQKGEKIHA